MEKSSTETFKNSQIQLGLMVTSATNGRKGKTFILFLILMFNLNILVTIFVEFYVVFHCTISR